MKSHISSRIQQRMHQLREMEVHAVLSSGRRISNQQHYLSTYHVKQLLACTDDEEQIRLMSSPIRDNMRLQDSQLKMLLVKSLNLIIKGNRSKVLAEFVQSLFFDTSFGYTYDLTIVSRIIMEISPMLAIPSFRPHYLSPFQNWLAVLANISCNSHLHHLILNVPIQVLPKLTLADEEGMQRTTLQRILCVMLYNLCKFVQSQKEGELLLNCISKLTLQNGNLELYQKRLIKLMNPVRFLAYKFPALIVKVGGSIFVLLQSVTFIERHQDFITWGKYLEAVLDAYISLQDIFITQCQHVINWLLDEIRAGSPSTSYCLRGFKRLAEQDCFYQHIDLDSLIHECQDRQFYPQQKLSLLHEMSFHLDKIPVYLHELLFQTVLDGFFEMDRDSRLNIKLLGMLQNMLQQSGMRRKYVDRLFTTGVGRKIEELQDSKSRSVYELSYKIMEQYLQEGKY